ncbi:MAG TPA: sigma-70 family RNA polymerase sigma factor [Acidimicrobiales bacterium]|nr:sigma-70 family RNA polymerase sigma factor [Acidimicrobiales bacterium]
MAKRADEDWTDVAEPVGTRGARGTVATEDRIRTYLETEHRRVVAAVSLWTGSVDDATDAVTDALGRAWERLDRGESIGNLAAWVTHAAMNQIRSSHRRIKVAQRKRHLVGVTDTEDDPTASRDQYLDLRRALRELTKRQRDVLALYYGLDQPVAAIADTLGIASGTVKATLYQARARLEHLLTPSPAGDTDD